MGLRELQKHGSHPVYTALKPFFNQSFLVMGPEDENALASHKANFKLLSKQYAISTFIMQNASLQNDAWREAFAAYQWFLENLNLSKTKERQVPDLVHDTISVLILSSLTIAMREITKKDDHLKALNALCAATIGAI
jgi:heme/copper-type cytochrome/quinol oxidase subunit 3